MSVFSTSARRAPHPGQVVGAGIGAPHARPEPALPTRQGDGIALGSRLRDWKTLAGFALSAAIMLIFVLTAHLNPGQIWATVRTADGRYLVLGQAVYFGAFLLRGLRWRLLLRRADLGAAVRLPGLRGLVEMIFLSWFVNCLVPAKLGDAYRAYLLKQETGADMGLTLGTVVGERMADVLALVVLLQGSGLLILGNLTGAGGHMPLILLLGAGLAGAIGGGVGALRLGAGPLAARPPERRRGVFARFVTALLRTFQRDIQVPLYGLTGLIWAGEVVRIWLVLQSFHITGLAPGVIIFTALAGSLLSTIPFTPAGLGAVEGASVAILGAFGVATSLAGAVAVVDRVINYWSNIPVGAVLYLAHRRRFRS
jgi:uncharacterized membrane protein YbhN (UPF0104 family)